MTSREVNPLFRCSETWLNVGVPPSPLPCYAGVTGRFSIAAAGSTRGVKQRVFFCP